MPDSPPIDRPTTLRRSLGLPMLTFYGLGTIVGGGFYALTGKVAAEAGNFSLWWIKRRESAPPEEGPNYPIWLPMTGCPVCMVFLIFHAVLSL